MHIVLIASEALVNLSSADILQVYLSAFSNKSTDKPAKSDQSSLTAGAIAGITISTSLVIVVAMIAILLLSIKLYQYKQRRM